ncbi:MAG: LysM peptidoglycan-binding domain-containing protein [Pseudomonadota bacterium]
MNLLEFAKDVGRQLFDTDAEAADNIKQHLDIRLSGIRNVEVTFDDGVATVCGDCDNEAVKEQALLMVGNIKGVERIVADDLRAPTPKPEERPVQDMFYIIESGDTLGGISKKFYGNSAHYMRIFNANLEIIDDPNVIFPGQKIRIPIG